MSGKKSVLVDSKITRRDAQADGESGQGLLKAYMIEEAICYIDKAKNVLRGGEFRYYRKILVEVSGELERMLHKEVRE